MESKKLKILVVEDDPFILEMYRGKLEKMGYEVVSACSGKQGLSCLEKELFNLILLDAVMPEMDGFEMLKILKKDEVYKKIPVILLTNLSQQEDIKKGFALGAVDYMVKAHFTPSEVVEKIKKFSEK